MQWRWDHDREAVNVEEDAKTVHEAASRAEALRKRAEYLSTVSLEKLLDKDLFPTWEDYPPMATKEACQSIIQSFIRSLATAPQPLPEDSVRKKLRECVQAINQLDSEQDNFIETVEREDLCEVLEVVLYAAKFPELSTSIEDWRDW